MDLRSGTRLGVFEIAQLIGAGGFGEVYRARDTKLGRDVAIKVLPEAFALDPQRVAWFEREAQLLAALDHPNIGALYDFQEAGGVRFLVLQLVEGETLEDRIERGPIPVDEALPIFAQIAGALEAAHDRGIVHRDLKPANIKLTSDDRVKVLDFGIAKSLAQADTETDPAQTPTPSSPDAATLLGTPTPPWTLTGSETIVGTPSYMSPEQARGKQVDQRSDIFAFGCCLYEALAGRKTFSGETLVDTISAITRDEPDWSRLPQNTPESLHNLLRRCLEKNPRRRLSGAGDIAITLEEAAESIKRDSQKPRAGTMDPQSITSLAVLPFENYSGDPEQEYFVDGMTDALSAELGKIKALKVISRSSAMRYKGTDTPLPQIARELGVEALVEGSVLRAGDDVRITAQLIHCASDSRIWGESYPGTLENILKLQGEVAMAIAEAIQIAVTPEEETRITSAKSVDPKAYEAYLWGEFYMRKRTPEGFQKAADSFQRAVELDPGFAKAHALLGVATWWPANFGFVPTAIAEARARPAIDRALALDDTLVEARATAGWIALVFDWDWARAEREFQRAIELNPSHPGGYHGLTWSYVALGRFDDATRTHQKTIDIDPVNIYWRYLMAQVPAWACRDEEAIALHDKVLELDPAYLLGLEATSRAYIRLFRYDEAVVLTERAIVIHGRIPMLLNTLLAAHACAGRKTEAEALLAELYAKARDEYVRATVFAMAHAALGNMDEAFRSLDQAIEDRDFQIPQPYFPGWWLFRGDPRFFDVLRHIDYPAIEEFKAAIHSAASPETTPNPVD